MVTENQKVDVLNKFVDRFEGKEREMTNPLIVRGELIFIAKETGLTLQEVVTIIVNVLMEVK